MAERKLKQQRVGQRTYVNRVAKNAVDILNDYSADLEGKLITLQKTLTDRLELIENLNENILSLTEEDTEIVDEITSSGDFSTQIMEVVTRIELFFKKLHSREKINDDTLSLPSSSRDSSAKLPKLILQTFSGGPAKYQEFWDSYNSAVHSNLSLDNVSKFNYLKSSLKDIALSSIAGLPLTSESYDEAI